MITKQASYRGKTLIIVPTTSHGRYECRVELAHENRVGYTNDAEIYDYVLDGGTMGQWARRACYDVAMAGETTRLRRRKSRQAGKVTQRMMTFRIDCDLYETIDNLYENKGRYINDVIRRDLGSSGKL